MFLEEEEEMSPTDTLLTKWLPIIYKGVDVNLVESFINKMVDEGYVTISDLIMAIEVGDFHSFESLAELTGMKKGHYNRLFMHLKSYKVQI